jgi:flagellar biosynthesis protein FlhA
MVRILEGIANNADRTQGDPYLLTEAVRGALKLQIVSDYVDENSVLRGITIDPGIERKLREGIHRDPEEGFVMALRPEFQLQLRDALVAEYNSIGSTGLFPVFIASRSIRAGIFSILERLFPAQSFAVIAHEEIPPDVRLEVVSEVTLQVKKQEEEMVQG